MKYFVFFLFLALTLNAFAGRGKNQQQRIKQGVESGELNKKEVQKLRQEQRQIRDDRKEAMADGEISKEEKLKLRKERNQASRNIYKQKHDNQKKAEQPTQGIDVGDHEDAMDNAAEE